MLLCLTLSLLNFCSSMFLRWNYILSSSRSAISPFLSHGWEYISLSVIRSFEEGESNFYRRSNITWTYPSLHLKFGLLWISSRTSSYLLWETVGSICLVHGHTRKEGSQIASEINTLPVRRYLTFLRCKYRDLLSRLSIFKEDCI